jgi:hypothetical protein
MKLDLTRYARPLVIAVVPVLLIAGAAFAAGGGIPALVTDPTSGPKTAESANASDAALSTHFPKVAESAEPSEGVEATHQPKASETAESTSGDENGQGDDNSQGNSDGDHNPSAAAGATFGDKDGDGGSKPAFGPSSSGAPSRDGGHH